MCSNKYRIIVIFDTVRHLAFYNTIFLKMVVLKDEHKTFADPAARAGRARESGGPHTYRILKFVSESSALESFLLTEGCILNPCYEIWKKLANNYGWEGGGSGGGGREGGA